MVKLLDEADIEASACARKFRLRQRQLIRNFVLN